MPRRRRTYRIADRVAEERHPSEMDWEYDYPRHSGERSPSGRHRCHSTERYNRPPVQTTNIAVHQGSTPSASRDGFGHQRTGGPTSAPGAPPVPYESYQTLSVVKVPDWMSSFEIERILQVAFADEGIPQRHAKIEIICPHPDDVDFEVRTIYPRNRVSHSHQTRSPPKIEPSDSASDTSRAPAPESELGTKIITAQDVAEGEKCGICTEEKQKDETVALLPCGHWFDEECVLPWLGRNNTCPTCRAGVYDNEDKDSEGHSTMERVQLALEAARREEERRLLDQETYRRAEASIRRTASETYRQEERRRLVDQLMENIQIDASGEPRDRVIRNLRNRIAELNEDSRQHRRRR